MQNTEFTAPPMSYSLGGNFDPNNVDQERVVLLSLCFDASGSTASYEKEFNSAVQEFIKAEQGSHIADEVFFQIVTFDYDVKITSGWQPIVGYDANKTLFQNGGGMTAGFDGVKVALDSMLAYGKDLQRNGTDVRYNLVIVTDGEFNHGKDMTGSSVVTALQSIRNNESLYGKFTVFMYGVGDAVNYKKALVDMTIDPDALLTTGASGADFKKMLASVSQSVSKSSSGSVVPNF